MSTRQHDYVPRHDADFEIWFRNIMDYIAEKTAQGENEWEYIPMSAINEFNDAYQDWIAHYIPVQTPHTPAQTTEKNNARTRSERVIRAFVQRFLHWPPVTDGDRVNMNIPNRSHTRTQHHEVGEVVEFELKLNHIRQILIEFWVKGTTHKAKPAGYDGAVCVWDVLDTPPQRPEDLTQHTMASRTPHTLNFDETQRGKTVYIAAAWQNERGNTGAWSEIQSAVIP